MLTETSRILPNNSENLEPDLDNFTSKNDLCLCFKIIAIFPRETRNLYKRSLPRNMIFFLTLQSIGSKPNFVWSLPRS